MICVDASIAVKWLFPEETHSDLALALLTAQLTRVQPVIAPPILWSEVTNVVRQRMRRADLALPRATRLLDQFLALPLTPLAPDGLYRDALLLASQYDLAAVYDAQYVVLARRQDCELWTDDQSLIQQLQPSLPFVRAIGEFQP